MNLQAFTKLLAKHMYPLLRRDGFRGSGANLRRADGPLVHVFNVQGSSGGERCYLNLGVQLAFLSTSGGQWQPDKVLEYQCAFRSRIDPPSDQDFGWHYGNSESESEANVVAAVAGWEQQGRPFFARYATFPSAFVRLVAEFSADEAHPATCLTMARVAAHLGNPHRAASIATSAIGRVAAQATGLRHSLNQVLVGARGP